MNIATVTSPTFYILFSHPQAKRVREVQQKLNSEVLEVFSSTSSTIFSIGMLVISHNVVSIQSRFTMSMTL